MIVFNSVEPGVYQVANIFVLFILTRKRFRIQVRRHVIIRHRRVVGDRDCNEKKKKI